jgi:hypothetical protein
VNEAYAVVWREDESPLSTGKLELLPGCFLLDGRDRSEEIPYDEVESVRVGRDRGDRLRGRAAVVLACSGGTRLRIAPVAQTSLVGVIAEHLVSRRAEAASNGDCGAEVSYLPTPGPGDSDGGDVF